MEVIVAKIISLILLMVSAFALGFLPLKIGKYFLNDEKKWKKLLTSFLLCFGGGVLFATSLIHILPEVSMVTKDNQGAITNLGSVSLLNELLCKK